MDHQSERLGSLMAFCDLGLLISTYGVLVAFNFLIEPVGINTWIVCSFFVGIKILILGIADITGIGRSVFVSVIFIVIADAVVLLINQLMAFGLSFRMLVVMVAVDVIITIISVLTWKSFAHSSEQSEANNKDWIYSDLEVEPIVAKQVDVNNEENLVSNLPIDNNDFEDQGFIFGTLEESNEPEEEVFSFVPEPIVEETPEEPKVPKLDVIPLEEITPENQPILTVDEDLKDEDIFSSLEEDKIVIEEPSEPTEPSKESLEPIPVTSEETVEEVVEPTIIEPVEETPKEETVENIEETTVEPEEPKEELPEQKELEFIEADDYEELTGVLPKLSSIFEPISTNVDQEEINNDREQIKEEAIRLNDNLNKLITIYNDSLKPDEESKKITDLKLIDENTSISQSDSIIRDKLKQIIDRKFVSSSVLHDLINVTNMISNRAYSIDVAENNLKIREKAQKKRQEEEARKQKEEALQKQQQEQQKLDNQKKLLSEQESKKVSEPVQTAKTTVKTKPVITNNEIHFQNDDVDIIIDKADLELLKEYLKQQDANQ